MATHCLHRLTKITKRTWAGKKHMGVHLVVPEALLEESTASKLPEPAIELLGNDIVVCVPRVPEAKHRKV